MIYIKFLFWFPNCRASRIWIWLTNVMWITNQLIKLLSCMSKTRRCTFVCNETMFAKLVVSKCNILIRVIISSCNIHKESLRIFCTRKSQLDIIKIKTMSNKIKTKDLSAMNSIKWFVTTQKRIGKHVAQFHFLIHQCHATNVSTYANIWTDLSRQKKLVLSWPKE